jgi:hypothetical protein
MDNLPSWVSWMVTIAIVISPGLAIVWVRPIARLLHYLLWPRPEVTPQSPGKLARDRPALSSANVTGRPGRLADRLGARSA